MAAFDRSVTICRPNPWMRVAALSPLLIAPLLALPNELLGQSVPHDALGWLALVLKTGVAALAFWFVVDQRNPSPRKAPARLTVEQGAVSVDGTKVLDLREVRRAYLQPQWDAAPTVKLVGRADRTLLEDQVADEHEGQALLDALELGVSHKAIRFGSPPPRWVFWTLALTLMVASEVAGHFNPLYGFGVFLLYFLLVWLSQAAIHVGADGILRTSLGTRRFYPYADITRFEVKSGSVRLWLNSGKAVDLALGQGFGQTQCQAFLARVLPAHAASLAGEPLINTVALVARGGRTAADWLEALGGLLRGDAESYRSNAIPAENLWRVADDPAAEETARVGAAVALRASLDEEGRARLLQIAEASASPKVRVALRAAASVEGDEALVEALEACEAERAG